MKRTLCAILTAVLILGCLPGMALAATSGTPDGTPPVLKSITLSADTVNIPGSVEIIMEAEDDVSGVDYAAVQFYCKETDSFLAAVLYSEYCDDKGEYIPYDDGKFHGTLEIDQNTIIVDQYMAAAEFVVNQICIYDVADNGRWYDKEYNTTIWLDFPYEVAPLPDYAENLKLTVLGINATADKSPPVMKSFTLSTKTVTAPGSVEIIMEAEDDSGVAYAHVDLYCEATGKDLAVNLKDTYYDEEKKEFIPYADGKIHGSLYIPQYVVGGEYVIKSIDLVDVVGNRQDSIPLPDYVKEMKLDVKSDTPDDTPPTLKSITFPTTTITAPGSIEVVMEVEDDVSGQNYGDVTFWCEATGKYLGVELHTFYISEFAGNDKLIPYADGKLHGILEVDQYVLPGTYRIKMIQISDKADNWEKYGEIPGFTPLPEWAKGIELKVLSSIPDVTTSVSRAEFVQQVESAKEDAYIVADYSGNTTLPEETFDALAGTDKTLDLVSEGVTWRFQGSDIINESKPIDLNVGITKIDQDTSSAAQAIKEELEGNPGVVLKFAENGQLPGKASIQVKMDYAMREYLNSGESLCVYYYNNQTGELELVAKNLLIISDTYIEFPITHCSYYVLAPDLRGEVYRLAGEDRFDTAFKAADQLKQTLGVDKFDTVIVASGADFADALSGSYLAAVKKAPILLSYKEEQNTQVQAYIRRNLASGGTVYILGGNKAVPASMESGLSGLKVKRLAGENRFETNLEVLKEAGVKPGQELLVATGSDFADCLSASATGKPILLVYKRVMDGQPEYLGTLKGSSFCIIGGTNAVNSTIESFVKGYGATTRLAGANRYETSVMVAKKFFANPDQAVMAYARNYPDGLCGGALAVAMEAPLILTDSKYDSYAREYTKSKSVQSGAVLGGKSLISDAAVRSIFAMESDRVIYLK